MVLRWWQGDIVHDRAINARGVCQPDIKEGVLNGGLRQSQDRKLAKLRGREPGDGFTLCQRKQQQQCSGKQKTVSGKDDF